MRKATRIARLLLAMAITFGALSMPMPIQALPQYSTETYYYDCQTGALLGEKIDTCGGGHWTFGQTSGFDCGAIKEVIKTECRTHEVQVYYYRWTGCSWYPTTNPPTFYCLCEC